MAELNLKLVAKLGLEKLDSMDLVRRSDKNVYALNPQGQLSAISFYHEGIQAITIGADSSSLEYLNLGRNKSLSSLKFEAPLRLLRHIYLQECSLSQLFIPSGFDALEQLYVQKNQLVELSFEEDCPSLKLLDASNNLLEHFALPRGFAKLAHLYLRGNQIRDLALVEALPALNILHLRGNKLNELPLLLLQCAKLEALYLHDNPLERFDKSTLVEDEDQSSWAGIRNYLQSLADDQREEYDQVKLVVLGNSTAGKSSLVYFLKDKIYEKNRASTHGMIPILWEVEKDLKVAVWDFGGQEYYHNIHHLFFSNQCLYLVVFETTTNCNGTLPTEIAIYDEGTKKLIVEDLEHFHYDYWLKNIQYLTQNEDVQAANVEVFKVQNKVELASTQLDAAADFKISVEKAEAAFQAKHERDRYLTGFNYFESELLDKLREVKGKVPVSAKWLAIKNAVQQKAQEGIPFLSYQAYIELAESIKPGIAQQNESQTESELETLTKVLQRTGVILYYPQISRDRIFISPTWLADAIYRVLDYKVQQNDGLFTLSHVETSIQAREVNNQKIPAIGLRADEILALMKNFDLIYPLSPELNTRYTEPAFIAPQYLPKTAVHDQRSLAKLREDILKNAPPTFSLIYPVFMPKNVMPRFIARNGSLSKNPNWRYGINFAEQGTEILAECDFEQRIIHIWIEDTPNRKGLCKKIFDDFQVINDRNPDILITKNQSEKVKIGNLFNHRFDENQTIEAENGEWVDAKEFAEFVGYLEPMSKMRKGIHKNSKDMYGIEKEIKGLSGALDKIIDKKNYFEAELQKAYDSEKKYSLMQKIKELENDIEAYRTKIQRKEQSISGFENYEGNKAKLDVLLEKAEQISQDISRMETKLDAGFETVLTQLSTQDQQLIAILDASQSTRTDLAQYFHDLDQKPTNEYELEIIIQRINSMIGEHFSNLPEELSQKLKQLNSKSADYTDVKGKFKLKIPIIPAILEYEKEVNWDLRNVAKQIWTDLKAGKIFLK